MPSTRRRPYTPRMPPAERRTQLLDAALAIIDRDGYGGVSIDAIAREAGVTRPVVYGVFDGLGNLLSALLDRQEERGLAQLRDALGDALDLDDARGFLLATVRRLATTVAADPLTWRPVLLAPEGTPTAVRERIARDREDVRVRIRGLLEIGLARRQGPTLDTDLAAHALIAVADHFGRMIVEDPERFDVDRLVAAVDSLLAALRI
jgi:AcrR family transcriptional regulator